MKNKMYEDLLSIYSHCCELAGRRGWNEKSAGGLSVRLSSDNLLRVEAGLRFSGEYKYLDYPVPGLARDFVLMTGQGIHMEDVGRFPNHLSGIIQVSSDGSEYRKVMGFGQDNECGMSDISSNIVAPSEDINVHLAIHERLKKDHVTENSVVYHGNPTSLTSLTYLLPLDERSFSDTLKKSFPQLGKSLQKGIGIVDELIEDKGKLADITAKKIRNRDAVIWAFNGVICAGYDMMEVIELVEALDKAAQIRLKLLQTGAPPLQEPVLNGV